MNVIWQEDASMVAIRSLMSCDTPPRIIDVTGPETVPVRWLVERSLSGVEPYFVNEERETVLSSNATDSHRIVGYPGVPHQETIQWVGERLIHDGSSLDKPACFQEKQGTF